MPRSDEHLTRPQREELRGIFTLGLMAILIALRISNAQMNITLPNGQPFSILWLIDLTLWLWGIYAFLMVVSLSSDILPDEICDFCYNLGIFFLFFSFSLYYFLGVIVAWSYPFPFYLNWVAALTLVTVFLYGVLIRPYRKLRQFLNRKSRGPPFG